MNWQEYQEAATRTQADQQLILDRLHKNGPTFMQLINGVVGLTNEVGELSEAVKKTVEYGQTLDAINVKEEVGDCLWRLNQICTALGLTLEECAQGNIAKLAKRYPEKYSDHLAAEANRNREAERNSLENICPEDLSGYIQQALDTGWEIVRDGEYNLLLKKGDISNNWAANWKTLNWNGQSIVVPHWLPRRLKELNPRCTSNIAGLGEGSDYCPPLEIRNEVIDLTSNGMLGDPTSYNNIVPF